jgi:hypothetical protein
MTGVITFVLLVVTASQAQTRETLPQIGVSRTIQLSPSYSCRPKTEFDRGYQRTALFLWEEMRRLNSPDVLFNGACGSEDYFQAATHGANFSVVGDLGAKPIALSLQGLALLQPREDGATLKKMGFGNKAAVVPGHTYAVLLDKPGIRGLFIFTVTKHIQDKSVELTYEVLDYQITEEKLLARR